MGDFSLRLADNGVWYGVFDHFERANLKHGISTRLGGISPQPYESLNLGAGTEDSRKNVSKNRQLFCRALGLDAENAVTTRQVHGDNIRIVTQNDVGRDLENGFGHTVIENTDALATNVPGIPLMLFFADCVPVIIYDPVKKAVGVIHAGWKGTVANIASKTLETMKKEYQTNPADCLAAIGPSVGPCCYEVGQTVIDALKESFKDKEPLIDMGAFAVLDKSKDSKWRLNLWEANKVKLKESGIPENQIIVSSVCTSCNTSLFFSHRAENGLTGRIGAVVCL